MIKRFIMERRSWIIFYLVIHLLIVFVAFLDSTIPLKPILYILFLSFLLFTIFLYIRYQKETRFFKGLDEWENNLDLAQIPHAESPFEEIIEKSVYKQTELLRNQSNHHQLSLEDEKDQLLAWIHEVKTPLTAMNLMIDRIPDEKTKASLTNEWLRVHLLLDQQLHQKRLYFIENDLFIEKIDLHTLLVPEIKTLQSWCIQKGIGFDINLSEREILSDAKWIAFILRQLLTNAVKYSSHSDIYIKSFKQNDHIIIDIQDFGRGIDPRDMTRIFEKGFTSTSTHQDHSATGMGLYLAKKAADSLLIQLSVQSTLGVGTTFSLTLPTRNEFVKITGM
ncbi:sensor histidine kinase [Robertmurraya korlensis]|uniref:sensor histidine kinase n=1 Tax=Robertmurraya korlensis TaxID=519977 RepID=UPI000825C929|nr:sensor histidine kinase [Robertmurraya korlensis]